METNAFKPSLKFLDATMLVAGGMIGSGVFIVSADIVRNVGSPLYLTLVWVFAGIMTVIAALSYGELGCMFPKAGGQYVYLKEAYGPLVGFLYGWSLFAVIQTATIAAVGVAFAKFSAYLFPFFSDDNEFFHMGFIRISFSQVLSVLIICLLTLINTRGIKNGKIIQTSFTLVKLISLALLMLFGFFLLKPQVWAQNWSHLSLFHIDLSAHQSSYGALAPALGAIAAAMVGSIFSCESWNNVTFIAAEIENPRRNLGRSLFWGTFIVILVYILMNIVYVAVLPMHQIALCEKDRVAVAAANVIFGGFGTCLMAILIMIATFGCNNGLILSGARVYYTMAKDGVFFKGVGKLNKRLVPSKGLWVQCAIAGFWCLSGRYGDLLNMISFVVVVFYMLTILGVIIMRRSRPELQRPVKKYGYPYLQILYLIMGLLFCVLLIIYKPDYTWPGLIISLLGIPVYYLCMRRKKIEEIAGSGA